MQNENERKIKVNQGCNHMYVGTYGCDTTNRARCFTPFRASGDMHVQGVPCFSSITLPIDSMSENNHTNLRSKILR